MSSSIDLWGPLGMNDWQKVSFINNQIATEEDVKIGKAVFYIKKEENIDHKPLNIQIPSLVFQLDQETGEKTLAIIIQAEKVNEEDLVGLRYFDGGNGICSLHEVEFIKGDIETHNS